MNERRYFAVQQAERTADIYIFGDITTFRWAEGDVSAMSLAQQIEGLDVDRINVRIDSYGGSVSEGWAIYNTLIKHPAKVVTYADGFVASAALYPFMAGDERIASNLSAFYFHEVMTCAEGYAKDLRAAADMAETMTEIGVNAFTERAGMSEAEVRELMAAETWLTPAQALEKGIATSITATESGGTVQSARRAVMARIGQTVPGGNGIRIESLAVPTEMMRQLEDDLARHPLPPTPAPEQRNSILEMFSNF